jgi:hypothetical protein
VEARREGSSPGVVPRNVTYLPEGLGSSFIIATKRKGFLLDEISSKSLSMPEVLHACHGWDASPGTGRVEFCGSFFGILGQDKT